MLLPEEKILLQNLRARQEASRNNILDVQPGEKIILSLTAYEEKILLHLQRKENKKSNNIMQELANEQVEYGGEVVTRYQVYKDMRENNFSHEDAINYAYCLLKSIQQGERIL